MKHILLALAFLVVCGPLAASSQPWMEQSAPDGLRYYFHDRCSEEFTNLAVVLREAIEAPIVRHRIKPRELLLILEVEIKGRRKPKELVAAVQEVFRPELVLVVEVICVPPDQNQITGYAIRVHWNIADCVANRHRMSSCNATAPWFGVLSEGSESDIARSTESIVDRAMTDYVQSNPGLMVEQN
jgi:hypothetical protein